MATPKVNLLSGIDLGDLAVMLDVLRQHGVTRLRSGEIEVELGPVAMPPRALDDFALTGTEPDDDDDAKWDHVGIRLRKVDA